MPQRSDGNQTLVDSLAAGETIKFRPHGNSMDPKIKNGELVTVAPLTDEIELDIGMPVYATVKSRKVLHLISAIKGGEDNTEYQISNIRGFVNGWVNRSKIHGYVIAVEP